MHWDYTLIAFVADVSPGSGFFFLSYGLSRKRKAVVDASVMARLDGDRRSSDSVRIDRTALSVEFGSSPLMRRQRLEEHFHYEVVVDRSKY